MKYISADKLLSEIEKILSMADKEEKQAFLKKDGNRHIAAVTKTAVCAKIKKLVTSLEQEQEDMGEVSDGYHTFNELYYYRMLYNAAFFNLLPKGWVHKSKRHHTGEECFGGGWFIVMANLPTGQVSNHYELKDWDLFKVPEKEFADEWDGHTPQEAAERIKKYLQFTDTLEDKIKRATESWKGVDVDEFMDDVRGREQQEIDLEKEIDDYIADNFSEAHDGVLLSDASGTELMITDISLMARHFWNKGYNAGKEG